MLITGCRRERRASGALPGGAPWRGESVTPAGPHPWLAREAITLIMEGGLGVSLKYKWTCPI